MPGSGKARSSIVAQLTPDQQRQVQQLKERDREVRQHEMAHVAAGGGIITSGPTYTYQKGADGLNYAIGGEVGIDTSPGRTPEETIQRAQKIQTAALAPAEPSGQDRAIAAQAAQMELTAQQEKSRQDRENADPSRLERAKVEAAYGRSLYVSSRSQVDLFV